MSIYTWLSDLTQTPFILGSFSSRTIPCCTYKDARTQSVDKQKNDDDDVDHYQIDDDDDCD